ncbi:MAG: efflux RND transporter periplasmic adaptor subunit [Fibrobacteria bacterium]|nr:efflux RND transporter periplasmic adaptor subunit [Fibrobacteria bacterium]
MKTRLNRFALAALPFALMACEGQKEAEVEQVRSADTTRVEVVTSRIQGRTFQDWGVYPADLRGADDAILVSSAAGTMKSISEVGTRVRAGQGLCDIESDRYRAQLDAARSSMDATQAAMEVARKNVEAGSLGKAALDAASAQFHAAKAQFLGAQKQYEDSRCQAPFSGVVASRMVNRWQAVGPGTPTLRIVRNDRLEATFAVPETESGLLKKGLDAEFHLIESPDAPYKGTVSSVDLAADTRNRVVSARVVLTNKDGNLRPGLAGKVRILRQEVREAVVVPSWALLRREGGVFAMVAQDGKAQERKLELGPSSGDSVQVLSGLSIGDDLVVRGAFRLSDGTRIQK